MPQLIVARKTHAGEGPEGADRLAEGQSGQGDARARPASAAASHVAGVYFQNVDRHAASSSCPIAAPVRRCRTWSPGRSTLMFDQAVELAAAGARRQDQGLCGDRQDAPRRRARHPDRRRGRRAGLLHVVLARAVGAEGHAEGHHRQAQRRGGARRSPIRRCAQRLAELGPGDLRRASSRRRRRSAPTTRPRSRSGGRSSRRPNIKAE